MTSHISAPVERSSRLVTIFVLAAFLLVAALPAMAGTVNVFGPRTFVRIEGKPNAIKTSFKLPAGVTQCQLSVTGAEDGPLAANNVSVKVNDVEMLDSKKVSVSSQQPAALLAENSLVVTLKGKPGDAVTVTITGEVQDVPPAPPAPPAPPMPPMPPTPPMPPMLPAQ